MSDDKSRPPAGQLMLQATGRLLRPLVRALIRSGVTFPVLADLLRTLYVDVASRELAADGQAQTDSRLSLMTGIHRKELRRQRTEPEAAAEPAVITLNSRLIARWLGDPAFAAPDGAARPLPRSGPSPSFDTLVTGVTKDVHPRSVLDEWLAQGIAALSEDGTVRLLTQAFLPEAASEAKLFYFARNLHDHAAAATANVLAARPPFLDRSVHYDGLSKAASSRLEQVAREAAERTLLEVNRAALAIAAGDEPGAGPTHRVNLGLYVYLKGEPDAP